MSIVVILKFMHIAAMFSAVGVSIGTDIMAHRVANTGDVRSIRTFFGQARQIVRLTPFLFLSGLALGLLTAWSGALNLLAPWLLIAYAVFGLTLALHATIGMGWYRSMTALAVASPDDHASAELLRVAHTPSARYLLWYTMAAIIVTVFLMVLKPFS